ILGGITSFGYIVLWSTDTIYWSSLTSPFDFTPSIVSGAGYATPQQLRNSITACVPHVAGFMIFTGSNAVMATYQNSALQPFYFKEIVNSAGVDSADRVDTDANTTNFLAYTDAGIQVISTTTAQVQFPEVVDFINKGPSVKLNVGETITFTQNIPQFGQLTIILDRYLCISYKAGTLNNYKYNWVIVYDFALKRWGQLYCPHNAVLSRDNTMYLAGSTSDSFSGSYLSVNIGNTYNSQAKLILGRYQYIRARLLQFDELLLSSVYTSTSVKIIPSITGQPSNLPVVTPYTVTISSTLRKYLARAIGKNISLLIQGDFDLTSGELTFNVDGKR
ncbi:MAG: hypothetical protein ORO03_10280, partial [Alphaproteobacteria bacterium]|nr:hypothetical protein [Alphaproteobacteria bacterium]